MNSIIKFAKKTLINNRRSNFTLPTNTKLYPAQWNWDSAFIALGYSNFNLNYSFKEIKTLAIHYKNDKDNETGLVVRCAREAVV